MNVLFSEKRPAFKQKIKLIVWRIRKKYKLRCNLEKNKKRENESYNLKVEEVEKNLDTLE